MLAGVIGRMYSCLAGLPEVDEKFSHEWHEMFDTEIEQLLGELAVERAAVTSSRTDIVVPTVDAPVIESVPRQLLPLPNVGFGTGEINFRSGFDCGEFGGFGSGFGGGA